MQDRYKSIVKAEPFLVLTEKQIQKKDLKMAATLKNLIKEDYVLKQKQTPALKQAPSLKVQLKAKLEAKAPSPSLLTQQLLLLHSIQKQFSYHHYKRRSERKEQEKQR
jgi:hypothetical protein